MLGSARKAWILCCQRNPRPFLDVNVFAFFMRYLNKVEDDVRNLSDVF